MPQSKGRPMPKFIRAPEDLVRAFEAAMKDFPMAEQRKMFGYPAAFVDGQMFAGLFGEHMFIRLPETQRADFTAEFETRPFEPMLGRPMKEYVLVPPMLLGSSELKTWLHRAMTFAQSKPKARPLKGKKRK